MIQLWTLRVRTVQFFRWCYIFSMSDGAVQASFAHRYLTSLGVFAALHQVSRCRAARPMTERDPAKHGFQVIGVDLCFGQFAAASIPSATANRADVSECQMCAVYREGVGTEACWWFLPPSVRVCFSLGTLWVACGTLFGCFSVSECEHTVL